MGCSYLDWNTCCAKEHSHKTFVTTHALPRPEETKRFILRSKWLSAQFGKKYSKNTSHVESCGVTSAKSLAGRLWPARWSFCHKFAAGSRGDDVLTLDCWPWLAVASIGRPSWLTELRLDNLSDSPNLGVQSFRNHPMCPTWFTFLEETQLYPDVQIERSKDPSWLLDRRNGRKPNCKQRVAPNCDWAGGLELPQPLSRCFRLVLNGEIESAEMGQAPIPAEPAESSKTFALKFWCPKEVAAMGHWCAYFLLRTYCKTTIWLCVWPVFVLTCLDQSRSFCTQMQHGPDWTLISGVPDGTQA